LPAVHSSRIGFPGGSAMYERGPGFATVIPWKTFGGASYNA